MFEPKYFPQLNDRTESVSGMSYLVQYKSLYIEKDDPNAEPLHLHRYLEIFVNLNSDVSFLVNNNLYPVDRGSAVISRPGDVHMAHFDKSEIHKFVCVWIDADLASPVFSFLHSADFCPLFSFDEATGKKLNSCILSLLDAHVGEASALKKTAHLLELLSLFEEGGGNDGPLGVIPNNLQSILDDIHENFIDIHTVNDVLKRHFVSSATLTRWFRKYLNSTPREYLESVRLSSAATLLLHGASVTDACLNSGFSDCSHFIVLFKKKFGMTPMQYKKTQI